MRCPYCSSLETQVKDSRAAEENTAIRRRRICNHCQGRFTTFERIHLRDMIVIKRSGKRSIFERDKLQKSIETATRKRSIEQEKIDQLVSGLVRQLESRGEQEVSSADIGALALNALRHLDNVAYVRFASVYKDFDDIKDFEKLLYEFAQQDSDDTHEEK